MGGFLVDLTAFYAKCIFICDVINIIIFTVIEVIAQQKWGGGLG